MASILYVPVVFVAFSMYLYWLSVNVPTLNENDVLNQTRVTFPSSLDELKQLSSLLLEYRTKHFTYVLILFSSAYIFKQTFAIPGSVFLNLLAGALFGQWFGFVLACILSAVGATFCFLLSKFFGKEYIVKYFPDYLTVIQKKIEENLDSLFFFLLFIRAFPMTPNWFVNMACPICNVPIHLFFLSVLVGLMPYNFICTQAGCILSQINTLDNIFSSWTLVKIFAIANIALIPGVLIKNHHEKREKMKQLQTLKED